MVLSAPIAGDTFRLLPPTLSDHLSAPLLAVSVTAYSVWLVDLPLPT